ncbi:MAG: fumarylacetoacetase [Solirubrobacteraceae bacterium]|nr:fumarylacetoacetase [Solirubrobacteraceae bacterium]
MADAYGVVADRDGARFSVARDGAHAIALAPLAHAGVLDVPTSTFDEPALNRFVALGHEAWTVVRERLEGIDAPRIALAELTPVMPVTIRDYVDCYSSLEHATNVGRLFRPDAEDPLPPAWRHLPIAYHGRAGTIVVSGTQVRRPYGIRGPGDHGPERRLDVELELGLICGPGPSLGTPVPIATAHEHLFGVVIVNDWSARELQRFEYQPLGPFLGKSFATSISPWVVPFDALPLVHGPVQDPEPLPHLRATAPGAIDAELEIELNGTVISRVNARGLYWSPAQQLAHVTSNGATIAAGDLIATGTISGAEPGTQGCLLELGDGFLADGDTVVLRGRAGAIDLGEVRGTVVPARE